MIDSMAKKSTNTWGGRREGSGRKPIAPGGARIVPVSLTNQQIQTVERWEDEHSCESFSAALREIIDAAVV